VSARDAARLVGAAVNKVASTVEDVHLAVLDRTGSPARTGSPDRTGTLLSWHRNLATLAYAAVRATSTVTAAVVGEGLARSGVPPLSPSARSILNAAIGDHLSAALPGLALPVSLRAAPGQLPDPPSPRLVVFIHGLAETDRSWAYRSQVRWGQEGSTYGTRLAAAGWTARYARYNTGRHISDSGADLDHAVEELLDRWPIPVEQIVLIGHSMGGMVARAALHQGAARAAPWAGLARQVVALGSPLLGADLEKGAHVAAWALAANPETRPLAALINGRSAGIKDLRFGYTQAAEWRDVDPDRWWHDRRTEVDPIPGVVYRTVSATMAARHPRAGRLLGDGLVRMTSAAGGSATPTGHVALAGLHHMDLLNHPSVDRLLRCWLA
jgi:pimeloyl-ACP methyl ester carboxylesterase